MRKFIKLFILIIIIILPSFSIAHVEHYDKLNKIEFDIYRNNKHIGKHVFSFTRSNETLIVVSEINFEIKKLGVVLYKYIAEGTEVYKNGSLVKFNSTTKQNKKDKFVNMNFVDVDKEYIIDGSSYKGKAPLDYIIGTWWNHSIIKAKAQISAVSGRIINQNVEFLGEEQLNLNGKMYDTLHFNFLSSDKKLDKDKKLNTHIWYEKKTMNWVKASFNKNGDWEYRLLSID
jgi:hypothetical protein